MATRFFKGHLHLPMLDETIENESRRDMGVSAQKSLLEEDEIEDEMKPAGSIFTRKRPHLLVKLAAEIDFQHLSVIIFEVWNKMTSVPPRFSIIKMALICDMNSNKLTFHEVNNLLHPG